MWSRLENNLLFRFFIQSQLFYINSKRTHTTSLSRQILLKVVCFLLLHDSGFGSKSSRILLEVFLLFLIRKNLVSVVSFCCILGQLRNLFLRICLLFSLHLYLLTQRMELEASISVVDDRCRFAKN